MPRYYVRLLALTLCAWSSLTAGLVLAGPTEQQRREINRLRTRLRFAGSLYRQEKFPESADALRQVRQDADALAKNADAELLESLAPVYRSLRKAQALLELEGIKLPAVTIPEPSPQTLLSRLNPNAQPDQPPANPSVKLQATPATGKETVSFARDIAPLLIANCNGCHLGRARPRNNLSMNTFTLFLRGGDSGSPIVPGKPADSLLLQKLKGTAAGQRMPAGGRPALTGAAIAGVETWIQEGGHFDGRSPDDDLQVVAKVAGAQASSHDELSAQRAQLAEKNWRLGMPGVPANTANTDNFLVIGNLGSGQLEEYGKTAEAVVPQVAALLKKPVDQPLLKGRMTLFFFSQRYDYSEFGRMVEKRSSLPQSWRGHWRYDVVDAYAALIPSRSDSYSLEALLGQQIAGVYLANLGESPRWFAEGSARVVASKLAPKDSRVEAWDKELVDVLASMNRGDDFLTGKLPPASADVASYGFAKYLMRDTRRYQQLLGALKEGQDFAKAFSQAFGSGPEQLAQRWAANPGLKRAPR